MEHNIHCPHCQEDMNHADWEANNGQCLHCDHNIEPEWQVIRRQRNPLTQARHRIQLQTLLRSTPVYV
ncbi:MAG: hypothetical protein HC904_03180 [Blastochloris sp.]|nr:hypothetical protein [Blastochloris sp.]